MPTRATTEYIMQAEETCRAQCLRKTREVCCGATTSTVAGIFLCMNVIASILACVLLKTHWSSVHHQIVFGGGIVLSFVINITIGVSLHLGFSQNRPKLFMPYIICATIHAVVSLCASFLFLFSFIDNVFTYNDAVDLSAATFFLVLFFYWLFSLHIVKRDRALAEKLSGSHYPLKDYL